MVILLLLPLHEADKCIKNLVAKKSGLLCDYVWKKMNTTM